MSFFVFSDLSVNFPFPPQKKNSPSPKKVKTSPHLMTVMSSYTFQQKIISLSGPSCIEFPPKKGEDSTQVFELPPPISHSLKPMDGLDDSFWDGLFAGFATATCCNQNAIKAASAKSRCSPSLPPDQNSPVLKLVRVFDTTGCCLNGFFKRTSLQKYIYLKYLEMII